VRIREDIKPHEKRRVEEAFALRSTSELHLISRKAERRDIYRKFLEMVQKTSGDQMVTLCAIGLGPSTVAGMKELVRLRLVVQIQKKKAELECDALRIITDAVLSERQADATTTAQQAEHPFQTRDQTMVPIRESETHGHEIPLTMTGQLSGRVFQLTVEDAFSALTSENVHGGVWLTEPYDTRSLPFVTFSISEDLSQQFALQRPQAM